MKYIIKEVKDEIEEASYREKANELLESSGAKAVVYGFTRNGRFIPLKEMQICKTDSELKFITEYIKARHLGVSTVRAVYKKSPFGDKEGE